jgi:hypothetical protein
MKYYLYRHIRLDTNIPFYIGIGTKTKFYTTLNKEYRRAYNSIDRTDFWKKISKKHGYKVDILLESDDYLYIQKKEIEFISIYKRIVDGGTLINFCEGGRGGYLGFTDEIRLKIKEAKIKSNGRPVVILDLEGKYITETRSIKEASILLKIKEERIIDICKNKRSALRYIFVYKEDYDSSINYSYKKRPPTGYHTLTKEARSNLVKTTLRPKFQKLEMCSLYGTFIRDFDSIADAFRFLKIKRTPRIRECLDNKRESIYGYKWKYKSEDIVRSSEKSEIC